MGEWDETTVNESVKTNRMGTKVSKEKQIKLYKENFKNGALFLWHSLQESELSYEDYQEIKEYIINLFFGG